MTTLPGFAYFEPESIGEACSLIADSGLKASLLAGGTDLLVKMKRGLERPESLVSLNRIAGLRDIRYIADDTLGLGALTTISQLAGSPIIAEKFGILAQAARALGLPQVRNTGTLGGNLCNASPAADTAPALLALDSRARLVGLAGERIIPLEEFFTGPGQTALRGDEILTEVHVPVPSPRSGGSYLKLSSRHNDIARVSVAVMLTLSPDGGSCEDARIALGAVAPTVIRSRQSEQALKGKAITGDLINEAAQAASETSGPRSSAEYRRKMVAVLTKRAIRQAAESAAAGPRSS